MIYLSLNNTEPRNMLSANVPFCPEGVGGGAEGGLLGDHREASAHAPKPGPADATFCARAGSTESKEADRDPGQTNQWPPGRARKNPPFGLCE